MLLAIQYNTEPSIGMSNSKRSPDWSEFSVFVTDDHISTIQGERCSVIETETMESHIRVTDCGIYFSEIEIWKWIDLERFQNSKIIDRKSTGS